MKFFLSRFNHSLHCDRNSWVISNKQNSCLTKKSELILTPTVGSLLNSSFKTWCRIFFHHSRSRYLPWRSFKEVLRTAHPRWRLAVVDNALFRGVWIAARISFLVFYHCRAFYLFARRLVCLNILGNWSTAWTAILVSVPSSSTLAIIHSTTAFRWDFVETSCTRRGGILESLLL